MNIQTRLPTTPDEFLRWNEGREGKREFVNGRVVEMMVGVSKNHLIIVSRLQHQLLNQLSPGEYVVGAAECGVQTSSGVRYPDILVDRLTGSSSDLSASEPLIIAEVLSPSSYNIDLGEKVADYSGVSSLAHYLVLSQDEPKMWIWSRQKGGLWVGPPIVVGPAEKVPLAQGGVTIDMALIYDGIPFHRAPH